MRTLSLEPDEDAKEWRFLSGIGHQGNIRTCQHRSQRRDVPLFCTAPIVSEFISWMSLKVCSYKLV